jgi:hypothetical protein
VSQGSTAEQTAATLTDSVVQFWRNDAAAIFRLMILLLVGLLFVLLTVVVLTGRFEIGTLVIAGVLFTGFSGAQFSRK